MRTEDVAAGLADLFEAASRKPLPELAAIVLAVAGGALHYLRYGEAVAATFLVAAVAVGAVGIGGRAAVDRIAPGLGRLGALVPVLLAAALGASVALGTLHPGAPEAEVDVRPGEPARLAASAGPHRLLVSGKLGAKKGDEDVHYDLAVGEAHATGAFTRTWSRSKVAAKGAGTMVASDHTAVFHDLDLAAAPEVSVRLHGELAGPVHVAAWPTPPPIALHGAGALVFALALVVDLRTRAGLRLALAAGTAIAFGELMRTFASPTFAFGPAFGAAALGAIATAAVVWLLSKLLAPWLPPPAPVPAVAPRTRRRG